MKFDFAQFCINSFCESNGTGEDRILYGIARATRLYEIPIP